MLCLVVEVGLILHGRSVLCCECAGRRQRIWTVVEPSAAAAPRAQPHQAGTRLQGRGIWLAWTLHTCARCKMRAPLSAPSFKCSCALQIRPSAACTRTPRRVYCISGGRSQLLMARHTSAAQCRASSLQHPPPAAAPVNVCSGSSVLGQQPIRLLTEKGAVKHSIACSDSTLVRGGCFGAYEVTHLLIHHHLG